MPGQGHRISEERIKKIREILASTDLNIHEIAERMGCSTCAISAINRRYQIRIYQGRVAWVVTGK